MRSATTTVAGDPGGAWEHQGVTQAQMKSPPNTTSVISLDNTENPTETVTDLDLCLHRWPPHNFRENVKNKILFF